MDKDVKELSQIPKIMLNKISEYNMNPPIDLQKSKESLVSPKMLFPKQLTELKKMPRIRLLKHNRFSQ